MSWGLLLAGARRELGSDSEARWLLEEVAGSSWSRLRSRLEELAPAEAATRLDRLVARRRSGEPLQHVLGHWSFRTLELVVDGRALVPRPETELVVEHALAALDDAPPPEASPSPPPEASPQPPPVPQPVPVRQPVRRRAADLGTGGGAIACSLVSERAEVEVVATDRSSRALELAAENVARLPPPAAARVRLSSGDWYEALEAELPASFDLVVANPPYLAAAEWPELEPVVREHDPYEALVAGPTGLEAIAAIVRGAPRVLAPGGALVLELAPHQADGALALASSAGATEARIARDLAGRPRVLVARWLAPVVARGVRHSEPQSGTQLHGGR